MRDLQEIEARLRMPLPLPEALAASMDAFEAARALARATETQAAELFAAFMMAADAAIDGREVILAAPSFPADYWIDPADAPAPGGGVEEIADRLASLGAVVGERLATAAALAPTPGDSAACTAAVDAARRIHDLMADDDDRLAG